MHVAQVPIRFLSFPVTIAAPVYADTQGLPFPLTVTAIPGGGGIGGAPGGRPAPGGSPGSIPGPGGSPGGGMPGGGAPAPGGPIIGGAMPCCCGPGPLRATGAMA